MIILRIISVIVAFVFALSGCVTSPLDTWTITDVELIEGIGSEDDVPLCSEVDRMEGPSSIPEGTDDFTGLFMWQFDNERPAQPARGDWMEASSDYTGYLYNQTGVDAYRCATARVTVVRNFNVAPNLNFDVGRFIQLYVVAPHLCNTFNTMPHPGEDDRQALAYAQKITQQNQTTVVFEQVIVASACGGGIYQENYGDGFEINFGQWPSPDTSGPLIPQGHSNSLDCTFIVGFDNFLGCP